MKAQWEYRGAHAEERLRREGVEISVTGKLAVAMVTLLVVSAAVYVVHKVFYLSCGIWDCEVHCCNFF